MEGVLEAVPRYSIEHSSGGKQATVQVLVRLPGVADSAEIAFLIEGTRRLLVHVPGRYCVEIPLSVDVESTAQSVRFVRKKAVLKATLLVAGQPSANPSSSQTNMQDGHWEDRDEALEHASAHGPPLQGEAASDSNGCTAPTSSSLGKDTAPPSSQQSLPQQQKPQPQQQPPQQPPQRQMGQQPHDPGKDPAAVGPAAASPREELDALMYAAAAQHSNREAAAEFFSRGLEAQREGQALRAERLLHKACKLDPGNLRYQAALAAAQGGAGGGASGTSSSGVGRGQGQDAGGSNARGGASSGISEGADTSAQAQGNSASARDSTSSHQPSTAQGQQQQQQQQQQQDASGRRPSHQEQRRRQRQARQEEEEAAAEAAAEALQAAVAREKARKARMAFLYYLLVWLAMVCVTLVGLYCLVKLAPPVAPLTNAEGGWKRVVGRIAGLVLYLPHVLLWRPTWTVAVLWTCTCGECRSHLPLTAQPPTAYRLPRHPVGGRRILSALFIASLQSVGHLLACLACCQWGTNLAGCVWATVPLTLVSMAGAGAACMAVSFFDFAQQQQGSPATFSDSTIALGMLVAWHPLLWRACGGGWGALLGTLGELLPLQRMFGRSPWAFVLLYPLVCMVLRQAADWLLLPLLARLVAPPLLWLVRGMLWRPRWWLSLPCTSALAFLALTKPDRSAGQFLPFTGATCALAWWLLGGGVWAAMHLASLVGMIAAMVAATLQPWPALNEFLGMNLRAAPLPFFLAKLVYQWWEGSADGWTWFTALPAAGLLYLHLVHLEALPIGHQRGSGGYGPQRGGGVKAGTRHLHNEVPAGAPQAVAQVLKAGNYYEVLGLEADADEAAVRRAKRSLSLATHPDKIGAAPGATDAFNLVTEACDVLGDAESRRQYDREMADASLSSGFNLSPEDLAAYGIPPEFADRMHEFAEAQEAGDICQPCDHCGSFHFLRRTDRPMAAARQCDECGTRHAVRQNEVWFETSSAGFLRRSIHMYCCYKGLVYDMSEVAECDGTLRAVHERGIPLNRHVNLFKGFGLSTSGAGGGKRGRDGSQQQAGAQRSQSGRGGGSKKKGRRR